MFKSLSLHPTAPSLATPAMGSTPTLQAWGWISASLIPSSLISASLISATFTVCTLSPAQALSFKPPAESVPANSLGGGVRGKVQFTAPSSAAPVNSLGGGVRGRVQFAVPAQATPSDSLGGGTRGGVRFTVPAQATPSDSLGGGYPWRCSLHGSGSGSPQGQCQWRQSSSRQGR